MMIQVITIVLFDNNKYLGEENDTNSAAQNSIKESKQGKIRVS